MRDWLKAIRLSKGLSTYQVAELAGIGQSYYWAIEAGERGNPLKVPVAQAIARALGQSVDDLFPPAQEEVNLMNPKTRSM